MLSGLTSITGTKILKYEENPGLHSTKILTCNDYYILTTSLVFSCHGLKLHSCISISFICHAYSARKSSLRSWIKRFPHRSAGGAGHKTFCKTLPCKASQGGSARFQRQLPSKLPCPCPSGLLSMDYFLFAQVLFPQPDERTLPQYKRRSLSDSQQDQSHPFQHFPRIIIQQHLHVPADSSQERIICTPLCLLGRFVWL